MTMTRTIKRWVGFGLLGAVGLGLAGCTDGLLDENPPNVIVADNLYTSLDGFRDGLNALYAQARLERDGMSGTNDIRTEMMNMGTDNAFSLYPAGFEHVWNDWGTYNNPQVDFYLDTWTWMYRMINAANTIVHRADNPDIQWTDAQKNEVLAEARFFRAWCYRHLTYLWGPVPLNLEESSGASVKTDWTRAPVADVRKQMEQDLLFAEQYLPDMPEVPGRLSKAVAEHYLAELYLAMDEPQKAEVEAKKVTESGNYHLITQRYGVNANQPGVPFMDMFQDGNVDRDQGNTEAIWVFKYQINTPGGGQSIMRRSWVGRYYSLKGVQVAPEYGGRGIGRIGITPWAIDLYEPQDDRGSIYAIRKFYLYNNAANLPKGKELGDTLWLDWSKAKEKDPGWPSTRKWDWTDPLDPTGEEQYEDQAYVRLAETYLLLAEAQMKNGELADAAATINKLRDRAGASEITPDQVTMDFILDERSRELLTEEERRYTLVRTHTLLERVQKYNPLAAATIQPRDTVFPIPQAVIDANIGAKMEQNPGY
ncbi:MAG TPA: RagB/SusD family nutrient uptake outer membrane protein [Longimicrobiaceae bacterium]|nr:RagB/SusD family nutrient uptake outer membrane protein [Longimicrobiaceae bacterium]